MTSQCRTKRINRVMLPIFLLLVIFGFWVCLSSWVMRREVAQHAVRAAGESGLLRQQVGTPIRMGYFVSGRVIGRMDAGTADLIIPISGPNGKGELIDWSQNGFQGWHVCSLVFRPDSGLDVVIAPDEDSKCERE
jgi:hypothetical protein